MKKDNVAIEKEENPSLEERMDLAQKGDKLAYASVLSECSRIIRPYLLSKIGDSGDLDDILQEILISVDSAKHTYNSSRPFKPWLFSIAKFRLYDYFRKSYRKKDNDNAYIDEIKHEILDENVTKSDDDYEELYEALDKLPQKQKKIIELMKVEGYTAKEVAKELKMSESAVKVSAHRSYKILKEKISEGKP